jgi:hypothetical protein
MCWASFDIVDCPGPFGKQVSTESAGRDLEEIPVRAVIRVDRLHSIATRHLALETFLGSWSPIVGLSGLSAISARL